MSGSISCKNRADALLAAARRGQFPPDDHIREVGDDCAGEFFRDVVEPLADSFDLAQAAAYGRLMRAWIPAMPAVSPVIPSRVETVYVLSRVTLGADIKIVSPMLAAMKKRFPDARIVFVANRKSAELFAADSRIEHLKAEYPRSGPVGQRLEFAEELRAKLRDRNSIVVDPDSRMTQLGLIPVCAPENYFHFPEQNCRRGWIGEPYRFGKAVAAGNVWGGCGGVHRTGDSNCIGARPRAAVSLGVGDNESKRVGGDFEAMMIMALSTRHESVWVDRGVGGEEARRVTAAVEESCAADRVHFWEGGFAGFASIISQCDLYAGYDSAGQHAAAAAAVPLISVFAGAPSERFRQRWTPAGHRSIVRIVTDGMTPETMLNEFITWLPLD